MQDNVKTLFEKTPVPRAVLKNAVPAMAAMLMVLIYNLADTFFIARTRDDLLVAAVSLTTPVFLLFMAVGSVFGIAGAAIATVIGNAAGAGYYLLYFLRGKSTLSIRLRDFSARDRIASGVLAIGVPASLGSLLMSVSQIIVNARMAGYGDMAVAGMGVAMKVTMMTGMICIGFGQGVQPLLGYCVGAGLWARFRRIMTFSVCFSLGLSGGMTALCYLLRDAIIRVFLTEPASFDHALSFTGILLTTSFLFGVFYVLTNALQAMGAATQALIINLSRQGILYIPALYILQALLEAEGLAWAQPAADVLSTALVAALYRRTARRLMTAAPAGETP